VRFIVSLIEREREREREIDILNMPVPFYLKENVKFTKPTQQLLIWGPPLCEGLLYSCCDSVVYESNSLFKRPVQYLKGRFNY
jgi:hypothetical protein